MFEPIQIASKFAPGERVVVYEGDCRQMLASLPSESIQLVVTSPPYNLGKEYETDLRLADYVEQQREVIKECVRILKNTGSICWQVGKTAPWLEADPQQQVLFETGTRYGVPK